MEQPFILKAQSPAALAEEYIVKSIWENKYPAGSELPAERELADKIGVTRTTLREVLQRLARDGWLTIQHGKATRVNDIWETAGPNILSTMLKLDHSLAPVVVANVLSLRTRMAEYYVREAVKISPVASLELFKPLAELADTPEAYVEFDYNLFRQFTFIANKPVYALVLNSFKAMYLQVASLFFQNAAAREMTHQFYLELQSLCKAGDYNGVMECIIKNRQASGQFWGAILQTLPDNFGEPKMK